MKVTPAALLWSLVNSGGWEFDTRYSRNETPGPAMKKKEDRSRTSNPMLDLPSLRRSKS